MLILDRISDSWFTTAFACRISTCALSRSVFTGASHQPWSRETAGVNEYCQASTTKQVPSNESHPTRAAKREANESQTSIAVISGCNSPAPYTRVYASILITPKKMSSLKKISLLDLVSCLAGSAVWPCVRQTNVMYQFLRVFNFLNLLSSKRRKQPLRQYFGQNLDFPAYSRQGAFANTFFCRRSEPFAGCESLRQTKKNSSDPLTRSFFNSQFVLMF